MTEHSAAVLAGAKAMYEAYFEGQWEEIPDWHKGQYCQAFAAGLAEYHRLACNGGDV